MTSGDGVERSLASPGAGLVAQPVEAAPPSR